MGGTEMDMEEPSLPAVAALSGTESPTTATVAISSAKVIRYLVDLLMGC